MRQVAPVLKSIFIFRTFTPNNTVAMKLQLYNNTTKIYLIMVWEFPNKTATTRHFSNTKKNV